MTALILGLVLTGIVGVQSLAILTTPFVPRLYSDAASMGVMMAIALAVGTGFALTTPKVSIFASGIAAFIGAVAGSTTPYTDLRVWAFVAAALAVLSLFASRKRVEGVADFDRPVAAPMPEANLAPASNAHGASPAGAVDVIAQFERLGRLHASGALSDEEFGSLKAQLLSLKAN